MIDKNFNVKTWFYTLLGSLGVLLFSTNETLAQFAAIAPVNDTIDELSSNVIDNTLNIPGIISVFAYLTGLILGVKGVLDLKKHAIGGEREMPLRTPIIEFIVSGLLLALPFTYEVLIETILEMNGATFGPLVFAPAGSNSVHAMIGGAVTTWGAPSAACASASWTGQLAGIVCNLWGSIATLPGLISAFSYIAGLTLLYLALVGFKDSVENPGQNPLTKPFGMIVTATFLLVFPYIVGIVWNSVFGVSGAVTSQTESGFTLHTSAAGQTLDYVVGNFVFNIHGVTQFVIRGFCYMVGLIFIMMGIFRMMKTMQDGPRGPGGIGTIMTFITGAGFLAIGPLMGTFATSLFGTTVSQTGVNLNIPGGGIVDYEQRIENFISSVLAYMIVIGWVAFVRGLFIVRQVAEGEQQASMMAALTHIFGGAVLVNLGNFLNVIQATLGPIPGLPTINFT